VGLRQCQIIKPRYSSSLSAVEGSSRREQSKGAVEGSGRQFVSAPLNELNILLNELNTPLNELNTPLNELNTVSLFFDNT
jgi:hypothetical protein